jgi:hypothetical protein
MIYTRQSRAGRLLVLVGSDSWPYGVSSKELQVVKAEGWNELGRVIESTQNISEVYALSLDRSGLNGTHMWVPWAQETDFPFRLLAFLKEKGVSEANIGLYNLKDDSPSEGRWVSRSKHLQTLADGKAIYLVAADNLVTLKLCEEFAILQNSGVVRNGKEIS